MSEIKFALDEDGRPTCSGGCPIWDTCKHAGHGEQLKHGKPCIPGILEIEGKVGDFQVEIDGITKTIPVPANIAACELNDLFKAHGIDTHRVYTVTPADALLARIARLEGVEEQLVAERAKTAAWKQWLEYKRMNSDGVGTAEGTDAVTGEHVPAVITKTWEEIAATDPWPSYEEEKAEAVEDSDTFNVDDD
jgi:hypothetical protein